jgi:uncharacterized small protein (DUF1192 family)
MTRSRRIPSQPRRIRASTGISMTSRLEKLEHRIAALESEIDRLSRTQKTGPNSDDLELVIGFVRA